MSRIAIIPARGGSKRLPRKNILPFFGHPLLAYTIAAARHSDLFSQVIVSTDDDQIGAIAAHYGATYLPRPPALATDEAGLVGVALHLLDQLAAQGVTVEALCQLMPNCPLRRAADINDHHRQFEARAADFQISVIDYRGVYPYWALRQRSDGTGEWVFGNAFHVRSQQLATVTCPTGAIWWARAEPFRAQQAFYGDPFHLAQMDANRGIDIDDEEELALADLLVRGLRDRDGISPLEPVEQPPYSPPDTDRE